MEIGDGKLVQFGQMSALADLKSFLQLVPNRNEMSENVWVPKTLFKANMLRAG